MKEKSGLEAKASNTALHVQAQAPHTLPVESPAPLPIPKLSPLLEDDYLERSLPPLPGKSPLTPVLPLNVPDKESKVKKHPDLHIDLSEFQGSISPSIYPSTSAGPSPGEQSHGGGGTMSSSPGIKKLPQLARLDTTLTTLSNRSSVSNNKVVIAPSICPSSSRPASTLFSSSPTGCSTPGSARSSASSSQSITNLSQLSVVRQRLAQIERNHSQLSAESETQRKSSKISGISSPSSSRASTPTSVPVSPAASGWSKGEAVFLNTRKTTSSRSKGAVSPSESNASSSKELRTSAILISTRNESKGNKHKDGHESNNNSSSSTSTIPTVRDENLRSSESNTKATVAESKTLPNLPPASPLNLRSPPQNPQYSTSPSSRPSKEEIEKISKDLSSIKNVLGGETGYSTMHQMMVSLEHRMSGDERHLVKIQDTLKVIGKRVTDAMGMAVAVAEDAKSKTSKTNDTFQNPKDSSCSNEDHLAVITALKDVQDLLAHELPVLSGKLQEIKEAQEKDRHKVHENEDTSNSNSASPGNVGEGGGRARDVDLQALFVKIEEIRVLCATTSTTSEEDRGDAKGDTGVSEVCLLRYMVFLRYNMYTTQNITKILTLVQEEGNKQTLLSQQQADSVRYLNELNTVSLFPFLVGMSLIFEKLLVVGIVRQQRHVSDSGNVIKY